jgi:hypothetical protein
VFGNFFLKSRLILYEFWQRPSLEIGFSFKPIESSYLIIFFELLVWMNKILISNSNQFFKKDLPMNSGGISVYLDYARQLIRLAW